jgi:hypothetical protein
MMTSYKFILSLILLSFTWPALGQDSSLSADEAIAKVYAVLTGSEKSIPSDHQNIEKLLSRAPWEALAYLPVGIEPDTNDLQQAVPDYYRFRDGTLLLRLIDPKNQNQFGMSTEVGYKLKDQDIVIIDPSTGGEADRWQIIYLDKNYLALDMLEFRIFFTRTAPQER